jgi:ribose 5-phosphate isomerase A
MLRDKILSLAGVLEVGIFTRKPDVIYRAKANGKFDVL